MKAPKRLIELMVAEVNEPKNYIEAIMSAEKVLWSTAMEEEMASLEENSTWDLVELPTGRKAISNRWIYRLKRNADGEIT